MPIEQSRRLKHALEAAGRPVRYVEVNGMGHGPSTDEETTKVFEEIATFLATHLAPAGGGRRRATGSGRWRGGF